MVTPDLAQFATNRDTNALVSDLLALARDALPQVPREHVDLANSPLGRPTKTPPLDLPRDADKELKETE